MTLQEILEAIDTLPNEDLAQIEERIHYKKKHDEQHEAQIVLDEEWALAQIREILKDAPQSPITYGTMDVDKLISGIKEIREGLTNDELAQMIKAMNEEYVEEPND